MKRIVLALLVGSALITSCGSNKSFNKKRHSHRNWVKVGEYTDSEFAQKEAVETKEETVVAKVETPVENKNTIVDEVITVESNIQEKAPEASHMAVENNEEIVVAAEHTTEESNDIVEIETNEVEALSTPSEKESKTPAFKKRREKRNGGIMDLLEASTILLIILAILIPPLAVGLYEGITNRFWISLLLTLLFFLPGMIYALLIVTGTI